MLNTGIAIRVSIWSLKIINCLSYLNGIKFSISWLLFHVLLMVFPHNQKKNVVREEIKYFHIIIFSDSQVIFLRKTINLICVYFFRCSTCALTLYNCIFEYDSNGYTKHLWLYIFPIKLKTQSYKNFLQLTVLRFGKKIILICFASKLDFSRWNFFLPFDFQL